MLSSKILTVGILLASCISIAACAAPAAEDDATGSGTASALTTDSVGVACRTLGEIGQCSSTALCKTTSEKTCKAKASALVQSPDWAKICNGSNEMGCGWQSVHCTWEPTNLCVPRSGKPNVSEPNVSATCNTLGELNACGRVPACKSAVEGRCRATDDAIASDPQWEQMCPRAGTSQDTCEAQSNCTWDDVNICTPRAVAAAPLDVGTACKTLGEMGACSLVPLCRTMEEFQCTAKASALASSPDWERICLGNGSEMGCGWQSVHCDWHPVDQCVPQSGPRNGSVVDIARACDTFGQAGSCSRAPMCKPVAEGRCRATANALAGDPSWADQCPRASQSAETCNWLSPNCTWDTATRCVPR